MSDVAVDPRSLDSFASDRAWTTPESLSRGSWERLEPYLHRLEPIEADMLTMVHWGMRQDQISRYFGMVQCAVSYRVSRARLKVQTLRTLPGERRLSALGAWASRRGLHGAATLAAYLRTWSQTRAAEETGTTQRIARELILGCLEQASASGGPHRRTARRVLRAMRDKRASRCGGARIFTMKTAPSVEVPADRVPSLRALRAFAAEVAEWEAANG